jgi:hypothetical protein
MKLIPPVNTPFLVGVVMGVCLWFENPIACLFEQVVMPEHFLFLVRQSHDQTSGSLPDGWFFAEPMSTGWACSGVWSVFYGSTFSPREGLAVLLGFILQHEFFYGEFDPGSGRTLAACLTHASRTLKPGACTWWMSGERVSNT